MTEDRRTKVDFDDYAERYEDLLEEQLSFFSGDRSYFSSYKLDILSNLFPDGIRSFLDFGCGIGLSLPHIVEKFPNADVFATDISEKALARVDELFPTVTALRDNELAGRKFDMIFVATVIHHIDPPLLPGLLKRFESLLEPGGRICIFEHNPWNPVTRHMVATCPFDEDAVLISYGRLKKLIRNTTGLRISHGGYSLFFPASLRALWPLEGALRWLPLGGQYFLVAE
ncbi:MAG: class I SAM-dependent methyltransferase [Pseudomonadota bacterium]